MTFQWHKKILKLCLNVYSFKSCHFLAKVKFKTRHKFFKRLVYSTCGNSITYLKANVLCKIFHFKTFWENGGGMVLEWDKIGDLDWTGWLVLFSQIWKQYLQIRATKIATKKSVLFSQHYTKQNCRHKCSWILMGKWKLLFFQKKFKQNCKKFYTSEYWLSH